MILKLEGDNRYSENVPHTDNEVFKLKQSKVFIMADICMAIRSEKNTKIAFKVKGQGQMSSTSNHF